MITNDNSVKSHAIILFKCDVMWLLFRQAIRNYARNFWITTPYGCWIRYKYYEIFLLSFYVVLRRLLTYFCYSKLSNSESRLSIYNNKLMSLSDLALLLVELWRKEIKYDISSSASCGTIWEPISNGDSSRN